MQTFVKLGEAMEQGRAECPRKLLPLILHGLVTDSIRQAARRPETLSLEQIQEQQLPSGDTFLPIDQASLPTDFDVAVRGLPAPERDAFILTELRGLTVREAAEVLGISKSSVDRLDTAARATVREELS